MMEHHQTYGALPVQLSASRPSNHLLQSNGRALAPTQNILLPTQTPLIITRRQPQYPLINSISRPSTVSKSMAARRHLRQQQQHHHLNYSNHYQQQQLQKYQRPRVIRASEYKNLRQVVPALRRQRDVGKVEVVTEAARYIDHLHKTLIERFVLCGIPDSLKDILGTDDANELNSQHIMNLVTRMAGKQASTPTSGRGQQQRATSGPSSISARDSAVASGAQQQQQQSARLNYAQNPDHKTPTSLRQVGATAGQQLPASPPPQKQQANLAMGPAANSTNSQQQQQQRRLVARGNVGFSIRPRRSLPIAVRRPETATNLTNGNGNTIATSTSNSGNKIAGIKSKYH